MKRICAIVVSCLMFIPLLAVLPSPAAHAAAACDKWVAKATSVQGTVEVRRSNDATWQPVRLNDTYCPGDMIRVQENSRADLALANQPVLRLDQNSTITLGGVKEERTSLIELARGAAHFFSRLPRSLEVRTAFVNAGVEGTEGVIRVDDQKTQITIFEGKVIAANDAGTLALTGGQSAEAEKGKAPIMTVVVRPRDAVQWALYYPAVIYAAPGSAPSPDDRTNPRFFVNQAASLLNVGRVEEAKTAIAEALKLDANSGDAYALQSVIAVVQNEKDKAFDLAKKAVEKAPQSATARIALSYAQQARFDLAGAQKSLEEAVRLEPNNALAWARLAELWSSSGDLDRALATAQKAADLDPQVSRTQTVLGFAYLTQVKTTEAKDVFGKAIVLDQAAPLPHLGMGLAKIREGDLQEGGKEIEIAASLDPNNSLIRSYLGKVYYEEKREKIDSQEYAIAKELDPQDPTPWFYDAIAKQTTNRPVEALKDIQKAIELNDNRAVYRSSLLLDSDLAARSASLARIYGDLGFQELALVEGWKSVNTDPTNFSSHRFLSDSYAALPRHEIARVSELLQSQLLQPNNITPIQPRLGESNLFLINAAGPNTLSFNEFNPLFNRDQVTVQANGLVGSNSTWAGEGVVAGIHKNLSYSLGGFHFETDGWRENADQKDDIANAFVQWEFSPKTSAQFEYRHRKTETGDLQLNFYSDDVFPKLRTSAETDTYRAGLRHAFSPNSTLLASLMYQRDDTLAHDEPLGLVSLDIGEPDTKAYSGELQHLYRAGPLNVISGIGYFKLDRAQTLALDFGDDFPYFESLNNDAKHTNLYLYSTLNVLKNLAFTLGASGDFFDTDSMLSESKNQFNPKFGVTWNILPTTTFRAAAFRSLKRTLITNQTLEPTQVAGFNQFYDDVESTESWRYGAAVDHKFTDSIFGGVEVSRRELEVPLAYTDAETFATSVIRKDWSEDSARTYLFWTPHQWLALSLEYQYEKFERVPDFGYGLVEATTHKVPLGLKFSHPCGASIALKTTYYNQDGEFQKRTDGSITSDSTDFWLVDAAVSYRLPKRYGFITVGVTNLFDKEFKYQETDFNNAHIQPTRSFTAGLTLALP